jgi:hypothetical protein
MGEIDRTWVFVIAGLAFLLVLSIRNRKKKSVQPEARVYARRIEGFQVIAYLHPRVSAACLADHGMKFGKGFRIKEGPALPHDELCRCRTAAFSITSTEAFHGALRQHRAPDVSMDELPSRDAQTLLDCLRADGGEPPETVELYIAKQDLNRFSPEHRARAESFLRERYEFLKAPPQPALPTQA